MKEIKMSTPLSEEEVLRLHVGDRVLLSGVIYGLRDAAHKRLTEALKRGESPPFELKDAVIYYVGPAPAKAGWVVGPAGPTTSSRMDPYTPLLLERGVRATIGKGKRSREVREAIKRCKAVYFHTVGGAAALLARCIKEATVIAYEDLGTEAVFRFEVEGMPLIVADDAYGNDVYEQGRRAFRELR